MLKIRRPSGRLIFNMGIAIPGKTVFLIETAPWSLSSVDYELTTESTDHYNDIIMRVMASQISGASIVYSTVGSGADQRKHQSSASLSFVWEFTGDQWIPRTKGQKHRNVSIWWCHHAPHTLPPQLVYDLSIVSISENNGHNLTSNWPRLQWVSDEVERPFRLQWSIHHISNGCFSN